METTLHRQLKQHYAGDAQQLEVRLGRFRIDAIVDGELVEIQHGSLAAIRDKIAKLCNDYPVRVVKPLVVSKLLVKRAKKNGKIVDRRQSPLRSGIIQVFDELVYFTRVFPHARLTLEVPLVEVEEWRYPGHGRRRRWRERDFVVEDQRLIAIRETYTFRTAHDLTALLPLTMPMPFDTADIARALGVERWIAQRIAYCLRKMKGIAGAGSAAMLCFMNDARRRARGASRRESQTQVEQARRSLHAMLRRIADAVILEPSRQTIPAKHKTQRVLEYAGGMLDVWIERTGGASEVNAQLFVLKFGGKGSRAERATIHPLDFWDDLRAEVWGLNWPGFGASGGRATISALAPAGDAVYREIRRVAAGRPVLVTGNSLGCTTALHVAAAHRNASGLLLRNAPPLRQIIVGKYGWWNAWAGAWLVAQAVPRQLDAIANAHGSDVPALFVIAGRDRMVPVRFQQLIYDAYAGPKQALVLPDADHHEPPGEGDVEQYRAALARLRRSGGF